MTVNGRATTEAIVAALEQRLAEAPAFFRNNDVRVAVEDGPLVAGCLARLDELAERFALRIIEVAAAQVVVAVSEAIPSKPNLAAGSAPNAFDDEAPTQIAVEPIVAAVEPAAAPIIESPVVEQLVAENGTRLFVGPVRSGVILDHVGHLVVFGDVNPGAEVRATGNIVVLGRLRGTAHAGIGQDVGFILALRLEPQQLRIGRKVARSDSNTPATDAEIAYATGEQIVVERYTGRLPRNLATSI
jgi:septum site-determining protein MinC